MLRETKTSICNKALMLLGEEPINSLSDNSSKAARICNEQYNLTLRAALEDGQWPFTTREEVVQRITAPDYSEQQKYIYAIPNDCALIVSLTPRFSRKQMRKGIDWDIRYIPSLKRDAIICNLESITDPEVEKETEQQEQIIMEYVSDNGEEASYRGMFIKYLVAQLAADICMPITHDQQRFAAMLQYAMQMRQQALQNALNEDGKDKMHWVDPITSSRSGGLL